MENITLQTQHRIQRAGFPRPSFPRYLSRPAPSHRHPAASWTLIRACFDFRWRLYFWHPNYFHGRTCSEDHWNYSRDCYRISSPWRTIVAPGSQICHPRTPRGSDQGTEVSVSRCYLFFYSVFVFVMSLNWACLSPHSSLVNSCTCDPY